MSVPPIVMEMQTGSTNNFLFVKSMNILFGDCWLPSNRVISSLEGKFGTVGEPFFPVLEPLFMKISSLCKNLL
jgi:hypothetical protein